MTEKLLNDFEYTPPSHHLGMAAIHLVFQPSDKLEESLNQFIKPDERRKFSGLLRSDEVTRLHYTGGDASGLQYSAFDSSLDGVSDRTWLRQYKREIEQIKSQAIPVAAYRPRMERTETGALSIELALLPSEAVKRKIGKTILRPLWIDHHDKSPDQVIYARTLIARSLLVDDEAIGEAHTNLMDHLGMDRSSYSQEIDPSHEAPKAQRMFVKTAFISDRAVS